MRTVRGDDPPAADDAAWEALPKRERHRARRTRAAPQRARADAAGADEMQRAALPPALDDGLVVATSRGPCTVELDDGRLIAAVLPKALARDDRSAVAVGDRVRLARRAHGELVVREVLPRTSQLARPDPFDPRRRRVLAANLERAVAVASWRRPPLATGLLDRLLVALASGGVGAAIAVNKLDLAARGSAFEAELEALRPYRELGVPVFPCSATTGEGLAPLRAWIGGRLVAFVGHSGAGKSSLINALEPLVVAAVGEVARGAGRGRHTTTQPQIHRLADGTRIVDTPGVREFGLWQMSARELAAYFPEFEVHAARCRFNDCSHAHEPRCEVRAAAERGAISPARFATYLRILASLDPA